MNDERKDIGQDTQYAERDPRTIEELREWYIAHNLPPQEVTRFFIGENYRGRRAFGIYRESDGTFVVYKNKDDGTRAVRYRGSDEAYAVSELLARLRQEISLQKGMNRQAYTSEEMKRFRRRRAVSIVIVATVVALFITAALYIGIHTPSAGYYCYDDDFYYYSHDTWFLYDMYDWYVYDGTPEFADDWREYREDGYRVDFGCTDFYDSDLYNDYYSDRWASRDNDSDSWSSSDSWDSDSTDWSSDW